MNRTHVFARLVALLFALLLTGLPRAAVALEGHPPTSGRMSIGSPEPLDLPALTLTQADFDQAGLDGFGFVYGWMGTLETVAQAIAEDRGGTDPENAARYARLLRETGWRSTHQSGLASERTAGSYEMARRVRLDITEFAGAAGAAEAFALLTDDGEITAYDVEVLPWSGATTLDDAVLWRYDSSTRSSDAPFHAIEIHIRLAELIVTLSLNDLGGKQPEAAALEPLVETLVQRIETGRANEKPGLSASALRFAVPVDVPTWDNYARRDGQDIRYFGESADEAARRAAHWLGAEDVYITYETVPYGGPDAEDDVLFRSYVYQFETEQTASAWMEQAVEGYRLIADAPTFGDESYTCVCHDSPITAGTALHGYEGVVRVGTAVALFDLFARWEVSPEAYADVARMQVACLAEDDCLQPKSLPNSLLVEATKQ